ncbi:MAG: hypothetical protein AMJ61_01170 [Desulfobacterales bacterium SG8_35_2]|nr:MAG: hypothetical protein AMJ61_01170 [Desulfobacterales bacterium SG8_35_2]
MKKALRNIFFLIIVFIIFLGLAPRFFNIDEVQKTIRGQIGKNLDSAVAIKKMHWVWLPLPHLTLINTSITDEHYDLFVPKTKIYPTWRVILGEMHQPGKIILYSPRFHINKKAFLPRDPSERNLPEVAVTIKNGEMEVESIEEYKDILRTGSLKFNDIHGKLKLQPQEVEINIQASSPFTKKIDLKGNLNLLEKKYMLSVDSQDIKLHKSVNSFFKGRLIPVESTARLTGTVTGQGLQHIEGDLHGTLPCFVIKPEDREIPLSCGFADLKLLKSGSLLRLDINDLEIKDPQVKLSGHVERRLPTAVSLEQPRPAESIWTLDISGSDLDLTSIRQKVLTLWGDNKVAKTVTDIVLGGEARSAAYRFSGRTADFKNLDAMIIEADVSSAALHVPGAELDLTEASGPIQIKDSILSGHGLSARLGNSFGRNAELLLDIGKHDNIFKLDIDIDADLNDLQPVLARLVKYEGFQRELSKFSEVSGRASGTLHLGDTLRTIITRVTVFNMQVAARYERIPQTVFIDSGSLRIEPGNVDWLKVKGRIGQQEISTTSGSVSWQAGDALLHIEEIQAQLDGASLLSMLQQTGIMEEKINRVLSSLNGSVKLTSASLEGPALKPGSWVYTIAFTTTGLTLASPLLPEPASSEKFTAVITQNEAQIQQADIQFLAQRFNLKGLLKHHLLENWYGAIEFNGPLQVKLANWIRSKGWFPEKLRPQIPCTMENLKVRWEGEEIAVSGTILHGLGGGRLPMASLDFVNSPEHLRINQLTFYAPGEHGRLELEFWRISPHNLVLSWEGFVNADTIETLFHHSSFAVGTLSGAFKIKSFAAQPEASRFEGLLQAENLLLKTKSSESPVFITNLDVTGSGRQLRISALNLAVGPEKITGSGQVAAEKDGIQLDLSLASSFLSGKSLVNLALALKETQKVFLDGFLAQEPGFQMTKGWDITGRIGFDFDTFTVSRITKTPYAEEHTSTYTFHDMLGDLQLAPDRISRTEIFSSKLCGLDFAGFWFSDDDLGQRFELSTDSNETFRLENVLPCLGVQQDIMEGEFSLQANLLKESNIWYGGKIFIKSSQGRILRLKTLSRIFKVVNITDLFEQSVENTGKRGFPFTQMDIDTHIHANNLILDRAIIRGEGLNLFARGEIHLDDYDADLTLLIAPFKTFDTIVSKVPIIGQPVSGEYGSRMSIPVAVKGPIADPIITPMHPEAVGDAFFNLLKDAFMLPYNILKPLEKLENGSSVDPAELQ